MESGQEAQTMKASRSPGSRILETERTTAQRLQLLSTEKRRWRWGFLTIRKKILM